MPILAEKARCSGCSACASICPKGCITMQPDEEGFRYPVLHLSACITCGLCQRVCPLLHPLPKPHRPPKAYAAYSKDPVLRMESSSGGVFSELAKQILANGGVVYGSTYTESLEVAHIPVENTVSLARLRGAKYAQSDLLDSFPQTKILLEQGQQVLFSGTPCQIAGLQSFLQKDYANLITVDFVCHGVPSPMAWKNYLSYRAQIDNGGTLPISINLRAKDTGWSHYRYSNAFEYRSGVRSLQSSSESLYMKLFVGDYINRPACAYCPYKGYTRCSDLTLGDFWGIWDIAPEMDDNQGTSVVLVHSAKGATLWDSLHSVLITKPVTLEQASAHNPSMLHSATPNPQRCQALAWIRTGEIARCQALFLPKHSGIQAKVRRLLSTWIKRAHTP